VADGFDTVAVGIEHEGAVVSGMINCRLWDLKTNEKMDKDRFRQDLGRVEEAYQEVARRLGILPEGGPADVKGPQTVQ